MSKKVLGGSFPKKVSREIKVLSILRDAGPRWINPKEIARLDKLLSEKYKKTG